MSKITQVGFLQQGRSGLAREVRGSVVTHHSRPGETLMHGGSKATSTWGAEKKHGALKFFNSPQPLGGSVMVVQKKKRKIVKE